MQEHRGYLLAISSMAAFIHSPVHGPYTASKAGVWALCDSTRLEVRYLEDVVLASGDLCQGFLDRGDPLRDFVALGG
ncbi:SDR family NAD(P)-dependent oxidoreductase [Nocardia sp. NPDC055029]